MFRMLIGNVSPLLTQISFKCRDAFTTTTELGLKTGVRFLLLEHFVQHSVENESRTNPARFLAYKATKFDAQTCVARFLSVRSYS